MKDFTTRYQTRKWEVFYLSSLKQVQGFACDTNDYFWVPEEGWSGAVGHSLFRDKEQARQYGMNDCRHTIKNAERLLKRLERA